MRGEDGCCVYIDLDDGLTSVDFYNCKFINCESTGNGVVYINDSIGTSPSRTAAGLHALKTKPILIAGGYDKHIPFDFLGDEICLYVKKLFLTGATAEKIAEAVRASKYYSDTFQMVIMDDFKDTVLAASASAEAGVRP